MKSALFSGSRLPERHVVIAGGGVIGVCCAYFLARRGARVTVLERDEIGKGASYGNAGCIAPGHGPINKPGRVRQALRSLFHPLSPLYVAPRADPELARWLWDFRRSCTEEHVDAAMRVLGPMGHETRALFDELTDEEQLDCDYRPSGYAEVYRTAHGWASARREAGRMRRYGFHAEIVAGGALRETEPALRDEVLGGVFYPEGATVNPHRFVLEMAKRALCRGAEIRTGSEVAEILVQDGKAAALRTKDGGTLEADSIVVAAGADSSSLLRRLGVEMPLQAAKGYHRDCEDGTGSLLRHPCVLGEDMVFCTPMDGFVRFAGTLEFSGINHEIRRERLEQLTHAAGRYLNTMASATLREEWCGLRPCLPDGLPAIGPVPSAEGVFVATGHAMMGLTLGPVTGHLMAEWILDGRPSLDLAMLSPARF